MFWLSTAPDQGDDIIYGWGCRVKNGGNAMWSKKLGLNDIEDLNFLAEEVLINLRFEGYRYDDDGNDLYPPLSDDEKRKERVKAMESWIEKMENNHPLEFRGNRELQKITFTEAIEMSFDEIKEKYLKNYLSMARGIMRKDTMYIGLMADEEVSDEYLDNLMAHRYKENLKLWTMQWGIDNDYYLLLYGNKEFHDDDKYVGIFGSRAALWKGYKEALEKYKDSLPGGKHKMKYENSSFPPDNLIIYDYRERGDGMSFRMVTPEEIWGEELAKKLYEAGEEA